MKKTILILTVIIFNSIFNLNAQTDSSIYAMEQVNPYFKRIVFKSIKKVIKKEKLFRFYSSDNIPIYIIDVVDIKFNPSKGHFIIRECWANDCYNDSLTLGYMIYKNNTILINSEKYSEILKNFVKIPPINNDIKIEIDFNYQPSNTAIRDRVTYYLISYNRPFYKIKKSFTHLEFKKKYDK